MHLIVVHGVPGVGKRTVCTELARLTGFGFFDSHHLAVLLGPVFGFSTPPFNHLRDAIYDRVIEAAAHSELTGLIATCIFEPSVKVERFQRHARRTHESGGETAFVGLVCDQEELQRRVTSADRVPLQKWTDVHGLQRAMESGHFDFPELPDLAMIVDTTRMSGSEAARHIFERLPKDMRRP